MNKNHNLAIGKKITFLRSINLCSSHGFIEIFKLFPQVEM